MPDEATKELGVTKIIPDVAPSSSFARIASHRISLSSLTHYLFTHRMPLTSSEQLTHSLTIKFATEPI
jgi:hypothetical protein